MEIYLVDGTYELFRHYFAVPSARDADGRDVGAVRGVLASLLAMMKGGVTHVAVATDHVIESFRNDLWAGYKTSEGVPPDLLEQFPVLDDALAAGAAKATEDPRVERVIICTPDKDLAQCVRGSRVVQLNRRTNAISDEGGVVQKFGVRPASIPDYLALVGDAADGYPGLQGWGAKSSAAVLAKFGHIEAIPADFRDWNVNVSGASTLAATLARDMERALLFRTLATLRTDIALFDNVDQLRWKGPAAEFDEIAKRLDAAVAGSRRFPRGRKTVSVPEPELG